VDLLIEMESSKPMAERMLDIYRVFDSRYWPMDVLVYTPAELAEQRQKVFSMAKIAEQEGTVLYESGK
jgi:uncharacterized protein